MSHRHHADPLWAPYRNAVAALWCRVQQAVRECPDCWRADFACRCGGGD